MGKYGAQENSKYDIGDIVTLVILEFTEEPVNIRTRRRKKSIMFLYLQKNLS